MDNNNLSPTPNQAPVAGTGVGGAGGEPNLDAGDWRSQLQPDFRSRNVNKIMDTLKSHPPVSDQEGLHELRKIAVSFEENIYAAAVSQSDYLQKISLEMLTMETKSMLTMETKSENPMSFSLPSNLTGSSNNHPEPGGRGVGREPNLDSGDWRNQLQPASRSRIVNKITDTLKRHLPVSGQEGLHELREIAIRFEGKIYTTAVSQSDYLRKISLKMLTMETKSQNPMANSLPSIPTGSSNEPPESGGGGVGREPNLDSGDWRNQ